MVSSSFRDFVPPAPSFASAFPYGDLFTTSFNIVYLTSPRSTTNNVSLYLYASAEEAAQDVTIRNVGFNGELVGYVL